MPRIENNMLAVTNAMFKDRSSWGHVTRQQKEEFFFIVNRLLSRRHPGRAAALNSRHADKAAAMDAWYAFYEGRPYPSWMWAKKPKTDGDGREVAAEHQICEADMELLRALHPGELAEEQKYLKQIKTNSK